MGKRNNRNKKTVYKAEKRIRISAKGKERIHKNHKSVRLAPYKRELLKKITYLERLNNSLLEQMPISVLMVNKDLKVTFANKNFYLKTKKNPFEVSNRHIGYVFPPAFVGGSKLVSRVQEVIGKNIIRESEIRWRGYIYDCKIFPMENELDGERIAVLLLDDISEETHLAEEIRKVERHLTNVVESANDIIFSADTRGRILTWNKAAQSILGYAPEEVEGKTVASLCFKQDRPRIREELSLQKKKKKKKKKKESSYEMIFPTKDGGEVLTSWSFGVIRDGHDKVAGLMGVGRDLTERRRLEAQLIQSSKMASLGTMASGMAHELRNPLAIASGAAQLLLRKEDEGFLKQLYRREEDNFLKECSSRIHLAIKRASDIIENLLRFSHISGTKAESVDVNFVLDETLSLVEHQISLEKLEIVKNYAPSLPKVFANRNRLQQVFMNLIINAKESMKGKKGELKLETRNTNNSLKILISDSGYGISKENIPTIFDPFFTTKGEDRNTGLGLFIAYGITKECKGDIAVESEPGKGTTFIITLPAIESVQEEPALESKEVKNDGATKA